MATYKVLQDIEAEDKLIGPLTLKQFIFAIIAIGAAFAQFWLLTNAPFVLAMPFVAVLFPFMAVLGFLAAPISREQPNDIWLLARLRFLFKPRNRIWNQDGISDLVTITVPKKHIEILTNNLSQTEVKSRLNALANTLDSRGWAIKNVNTNLFAQPGYLNDTDSDRLVGPSSLPQDVPAVDVSAADDILDEVHNTTAHHLDQLVQASTQAQRQQAVDHMHKKDGEQTKPQDYWFMHANQDTPADNKPSDFSTFQNSTVIAPGGDDVHPAAAATDEEEALGHRLAEEHKDSFKHVRDHMRVLNPLHNRDGSLTEAALPPQPAADQRQPSVNPAIIGLAHNDDLNVTTIAREANRITKDDDEVVISLH